MEAVDTSPIALHRPVEPFTDSLEDFTSTLPLTDSLTASCPG